MQRSLQSTWLHLSCLILLLCVNRASATEAYPRLFIGSLSTPFKTGVRLISQRFTFSLSSSRVSRQTSVAVNLEFVLRHRGRTTLRSEVWALLPDHFGANGAYAHEYTNLSVSVQDRTTVWRVMEGNLAAFQVRFAPNRDTIVRVSYRFPLTSGSYVLGNSDFVIQPHGWLQSVGIQTTVIVQYPTAITSEVLSDDNYVCEHHPPGKPHLNARSLQWHFLTNPDTRNDRSSCDQSTLSFFVLNPLEYGELLEARQRVARHANNPNAWIALAQAYVAVGNDVSALRLMNQSVRKFPNRYEVRYWRVRLKLEQSWFNLPNPKNTAAVEALLRDLEWMKNQGVDPVKTMRLFNRLQAIWATSTVPSALILPGARASQRGWSSATLVQQFAARTKLILVSERSSDCARFPSSRLKPVAPTLAFTARGRTWDAVGRQLEGALFALGRAWNADETFENWGSPFWQPPYDTNRDAGFIGSNFLYGDGLQKVTRQLSVSAYRIDTETVRVCVFTSPSP